MKNKALMLMFISAFVLLCFGFWRFITNARIPLVDASSSNTSYESPHERNFVRFVNEDSGLSAKLILSTSGLEYEGNLPILDSAKMFFEALNNLVCASSESKSNEQTTRQHTDTASVA